MGLYIYVCGILTEYTRDTEPERFNFVARNRIVAGMADAVVVVESKQKGGSLITADMAVDYENLDAKPKDTSFIDVPEGVEEALPFK